MAPSPVKGTLGTRSDGRSLGIGRRRAQAIRHHEREGQTLSAHAAVQSIRQGSAGQRRVETLGVGAHWLSPLPRQHLFAIGARLRFSWIHPASHSPLR